MLPGNADRNLLLGILAYQNAFITKDQLLAGMQAWLHAKAISLADILRDQGALDEACRALLEALVERHVKQHGGDPQQSLQAVSSASAVRRELEQLPDPDVQATIAHLGRATDDPEATPSYSAGTTTSTGMRFQILRPHAKGGLGEVFVARDTELNREVAVKEIQVKYADNESSRARFLLEAEITGGLEHPSIVPVYGLGTYADGRPFYAMRFIRGDSLMDAIKRYHLPSPSGRGAGGEGERALELHKLVRRLIDVCNALQYAHDRGVLHRDIKPGNIMLGKYGETLVVDWGLAKATGKHGEPSRAVSGFTEPTLHPASGSGSAETVAGRALGTPAYMSPEQAEGRLDMLGPSTDIYSLGATLYALLTGQVPADGTLDEVLKKVRTGDIAPPRRLDPGIDAALEAICLRAMALHPTDRYVSPRQMADDLEHWLAGEPVSAYREPVLVRARRWTRKHKTLVAATLSVVLAAVPLLTILFLLSESAREQSDELALRIAFNHLYSQSSQNSSLALVGTAQLLPKARRLRDQALSESLLLHLGGWSPEVQVSRLRWIGGHGDFVACVALSADGKTALTGSWDKTARLWDTATGKPIGPPLQHQDKVYAVALSADGKTALTGHIGETETARLWETATGKPIGPPLQHQGAVVAVALSADGKTALTGSDDKTARLWETATGKPIGEPFQHQNSVRAVALSADGKIALTGSFDKTARLWEAATGKPIGPPLQHQDWVHAVALSADGKTALTGSADKTARLWETAMGKPIGPPLQHQDKVFAVALSADGKNALTGGYDKSARLWETASDKPISPTLQHQGLVYAVALSADAKIALTGSWDLTARLWETASGQPIGPPLQHEKSVYAVALSADAKTALTVADKTAQLWDMAAGKPIGPPLQHQDTVRVVALSADAKIALTGSEDKTARLWDTTTSKPIGSPLQHQAPVYAVALSADGKTALTGSQDTTARLWETATGKPIGPPLKHLDAVNAVALSVDGKTALTGGFDKTARLWQTATGKPIGPPLQHQDVVHAVALSGDGKTALTGSQDKTARLWEAATGKPIGMPLQHQGWVRAVALSVDGKTALTGSEDNTARLWRLTRFADDAERIALWAQVITGIEADPYGNARVLSADEWRERKIRLDKLGGSPVLE